MSHQGALTSDAIDAIARGVGIDVARMRRDMREASIDQTIEDMHDLAARAGGQGTPFFMINGAAVAGFAPDQLNRAIEEAARTARRAPER
jgi:predicted DsbA family dithiol-disulfide isomerase